MSGDIDCHAEPDPPAPQLVLPPRAMAAATYRGMGPSEAPCTPLSGLRLDFAVGIATVFEQVKRGLPHAPERKMSRELFLAMEDLSQATLLQLCTGDPASTRAGRSENQGVDDTAEFHASLRELIDLERGSSIDRAGLEWAITAVEGMFSLDVLKYWHSEANERMLACNDEWATTPEQPTPMYPPTYNATGGMGGLVFPVAAVGAIASKYLGRDLTIGAAVYLTSIVEIVVAEALELVYRDSMHNLFPEVLTVRNFFRVMRDDNAGAYDPQFSALFPTVRFFEGGHSISSMAGWESREYSFEEQANLLAAHHSRDEFARVKADYDYDVAAGVTDPYLLQSFLHHQGYFHRTAPDSTTAHPVTTYQLTALSARAGVVAISPPALQALRRLLQRLVCRYVFDSFCTARRRAKNGCEIVVTAGHVCAAVNFPLLGTGALGPTNSSAVGALNDARVSVWNAEFERIKTAARQWVMQESWHQMCHGYVAWANEEAEDEVAVYESPVAATMRQIPRMQRSNAPIIPFLCFASLVADASTALRLDCDFTPAAVRMLDEVVEQDAIAVMCTSVEAMAEGRVCVEAADITQTLRGQLRAVAEQFWTRKSHRIWSLHRRLWVAHVLMAGLRLQWTNFLPVEMWLMILTFLRGCELGPISLL